MGVISSVINMFPWEPVPKKEELEPLLQHGCCIWSHAICTTSVITCKHLASVAPFLMAMMPQQPPSLLPSHLADRGYSCGCCVPTCPGVWCRAPAPETEEGRVMAKKQRILVFLKKIKEKCSLWPPVKQKPLQKKAPCSAARRWKFKCGQRSNI